jgi:heat shock protein HslJ
MKKLLLLACLMAGMLVSCSSDDEMIYSDDSRIIPEEQESIIDTSWKFYGFGSEDKKMIKEVEPSPRKDAYIINFQKEGVVSGTSSTNEYSTQYDVKDSKIYINPNICTTKVGEVGDGDEYMTALLSCSEFFLADNQLILYYDKKQKYLLFNSIDSSK